MNLTCGLWIQKLNLKNFATFDDQVINFSDGFNAIVGETGSGKSLILDALQMILGHRADKKLIRRNCDFAIIEASFMCEDQIIKDYFLDIGFPFDDNEIIIKRIIDKSGKSKSFINFQTCSLSALGDFSKRFIDLVGQFENQKLLSEDYQLKLLDNYALNFQLFKEYSAYFEQIQNQEKELEQLLENQQEALQRQDYLNYQINEIEKLSPSLEREEELIRLKNKLQNLESNKQKFHFLSNLFDGDEDNQGINTLLNLVDKNLSEEMISNESYQKFLISKESLLDLSYELNSQLDTEFDEEEFVNVLDELDLYQKLKRKFGVSTQELVRTYESFLLEKNNLESSSENIDQLKLSIANNRKLASELAQKLHLVREKNALKLSKELTKEINHLRMKGATISINVVKTKDLNKYGQSGIHFTAETNPGEGFHKIKDIASGGELSRILLALRTILSSKDSISVFLFDEIDTGIGGETALTVGNSLQKVSGNSQVIAITHLPQIAKFSDHLIKVSKNIVDTGTGERTVSIIDHLDESNLNNELNSMLGLPN